MWSLGIILYQFASSWKKPFEKSNFRKTLNSSVKDQPPPLSSSTSDFVKELIYMLLMKNPDDRPNTDKLMRNQKMQVYIHKVISTVSKNNEFESQFN